MGQRGRRIQLDRMLRFPLRDYWDATLVNQTVVVVEQSSDDRAIARLRGFHPQAGRNTFSELDLIGVERKRIDRRLRLLLKSGGRPVERSPFGKQANIRDMATAGEWFGDRHTNFVRRRGRTFRFVFAE